MTYDSNKILAAEPDELRRTLYRVRLAWRKMHDPYAAPELQAEARGFLTSILGGAEDVHWHTKAMDDMRLERDDLRAKMEQVRGVERGEVYADSRGFAFRPATDGAVVRWIDLAAILGERNNP